MTYKSAMLKAGYSESVSNNGVYGIFRAKSMQQLTDTEARDDIIQRFRDIRDKCDKRRDSTNELRANEDLARIQAMFKDKLDVRQNITTNSPFNTEIDRILNTKR